MGNSPIETVDTSCFYSLTHVLLGFLIIKPHLSIRKGWRFLSPSFNWFLFEFEASNSKVGMISTWINYPSWKLKAKTPQNATAKEGSRSFYLGLCFVFSGANWMTVSLGRVYQENYSNHHDPSIGVSVQPQISGKNSGCFRITGFSGPLRWLGVIVEFPA